jgi:hypothetical protein
MAAFAGLLSGKMGKSMLDVKISPVLTWLIRQRIFTTQYVAA